MIRLFDVTGFKAKLMGMGFAFCILMLVGLSAAQCRERRDSSNDIKFDTHRRTLLGSLRDTIQSIAGEYPGEIGVALIIDDRDTVLVNNESKYPMMSVFKMHQAIALCHYLERRGICLDTIIPIKRAELDHHTWSPMLKDHPEEEFTLPVRELLCYTLIQSDNNASNLMFKEITGTVYTDSLIATLIPRGEFRISCTEEEMKEDHSKAYSNYTSPLGAASLIHRLFSDRIIGNENQRFIKETLSQCQTGTDRIVKPLSGKEGVTVAHKTGSGYRNEKGELMAHNDVAYITLPNGRSYALAIFVKDFAGDENLASEAIARISSAIYDSLKSS